MATRPAPALCKAETVVGSPYCSDPNCQYCKELRQALEQLAREQALSRRRNPGTVIKAAYQSLIFNSADSPERVCLTLSSLARHKSYAALRVFSSLDAIFSVNSSIMARLNMGMSDDWRLLTQFESRTASESCHFPPALRI